MPKINDVLDAYFEAWNVGLKNKDGEGIRAFMSRNFTGHWANSSSDQPDTYGYDYDLHAVLKQMDGAEKSFEPYAIQARNGGNEYLVTGRETNRIKGQPFTAQCLFVWRYENDGWKLLREYIELER